jgi:hemerythrin-like domain-containing protein
MNIVDALVDHHGVLRDLYRQSEENPELFDTFIRHLVIHHTMEEKYFYDYLEQVGSARHDALEAVNEHHIIELIIKDAQGYPRDHENFPIKIEGLGEYTEHHLEEEELEIFPLARGLFSQEDLNTLGELFETAKEAFLAVEPPAAPKNIDTSGSGGRGGVGRGLGIGSLKG